MTPFVPLPSTEIVFRPDVPDVVDWRFAAVRDLFRHRALSPLFAVVAFERSLLTLELALRLRHAGLHGSDPACGSPRLRKLYRWASEEGLVTWDTNLMEGMYGVRNMVAHPPTNLGFGGPGGAIRMTLRVVDAINDLFEEPGRRRERDDEMRRVRGRLASLTEAGGWAELDGVRRSLWRADVLALENRLDDPRVAIALWPTFALPDVDGTCEMGEPVVWRGRRVDDVGEGVRLVGDPMSVDVQPLPSAELAAHAGWRERVSFAEALGAYRVADLRRAEGEQLGERLRERWRAERRSRTG